MGFHGIELPLSGGYGRLWTQKECRCMQIVPLFILLPSGNLSDLAISLA